MICEISFEFRLFLDFGTNRYKQTDLEGYKIFRRVAWIIFGSTPRQIWRTRLAVQGLNMDLNVQTPSQKGEDELQELPFYLL